MRAVYLLSPYIEVDIGTWHRVVGTGDAPSRRRYAALFLDEARQELVVWGGHLAAGRQSTNEMHIFNFGTT